MTEEQKLIKNFRALDARSRRSVAILAEKLAGRAAGLSTPVLRLVGGKSVK